MRKIKIVIFAIGFDLKKILNSFIFIPKFLKNYIQLMQSPSEDFKISLLPILSDWKENAGKIDKQYFYQDVYIANKIYKNNPKNHYDIGSRTDAFIGHLLSFREVTSIDIRPLTLTHPNATFLQIDCMDIPKDFYGTCDSLSSLHVIEHFGLGRYNDPLDLNGHLKAIDGIYHFLKKGGIFYFSTPISNIQRIEFNAHRVFSVSYLLKIFNNRFLIEEFSYIDDRGVFFENIDIDKFERNIPKIEYGCGIFVLKKL